MSRFRSVSLYVSLPLSVCLNVYQHVLFLTALLTAILFLKLRKRLFKLPRGGRSRRKRRATNQRAGGVSAVRMINEFVVAH